MDAPGGPGEVAVARGLSVGRPTLRRAVAPGRRRRARASHRLRPGSPRMDAPGGPVAVARDSPSAVGSSANRRFRQLVRGRRGSRFRSSDPRRTDAHGAHAGGRGSRHRSSDPRRTDALAGSRGGGAGLAIGRRLLGERTLSAVHAGAARDSPSVSAPRRTDALGGSRGAARDSPSVVGSSANGRFRWLAWGLRGSRFRSSAPRRMDALGGSRGGGAGLAIGRRLLGERTLSAVHAGAARDSLSVVGSSANGCFRRLTRGRRGTRHRSSGPRRTDTLGGSRGAGAGLAVGRRLLGERILSAARAGRRGIRYRSSDPRRTDFQ